MAVISCLNVSRNYGEHWAVQNLDFQVPARSIFALVGPNGAGKSSTIKMLATLLEPTAGRVLIDGYDAQLHPEEVRRRVGYLPDHFTLYEDMSVDRCLDFYGSCYGLDRKTRGRRVGELLELLDLSTKRRARIKELSRGMKQRVGIARALLHQPPVLLLDEPASGLDPAARLRLRQVLLRLKEEGLTILVSSHILTELRTFCDSVGIMQQGRMLETGRLEDIQARLGGGRLPVTLTLSRGVEEARRVLRERFNVHSVEAQGHTLRFTLEPQPEHTAALVEALVRANVGVIGVERGQGDLEWVYTSVSSDQVN
jgi:ABC-2 type transport system ATP-binding protein